MTKNNIKIDSVGGVIKFLRQEANLSLAELASRIGCNKGQLSKYENNRQGLSLVVIDKIAKALNYPPLSVVLTCLQIRYPELKEFDFQAPIGTKAAAMLLGRLGGLKGGPARAKALNKEQRKKIAIKAARARWSI